MSIEDNTRIVRNIHPFFNERAFDRILSEMIAEDVEWTNVPTGENFRGHEGFGQFMQGWVDAFPDARTEDTTAYAGEEFGVTEFIGRGTHEGPLVSPAGEIPPTERSVEFKLCEVYQFRDGKIVNGHTHFDSRTDDTARGGHSARAGRELAASRAGLLFAPALSSYCPYAASCLEGEFFEVHLARVGPCSSTPRPAHCRYPNVIHATP